MKKTLLSIAGFDPTAGAGAAMDLHVFQRLGFRGMAVLTSLTVQNTRLVESIRPLPPSFLREQYETLAGDVVISGIKTGMLGSRRNIQAVADILAGNEGIPKVVDPVFRSSSGFWLMEKEAIPYFMKKIRGRASILTPNLEEAGLMTGLKVNNFEMMKEAAVKIFDLTHIPCLVKGGHLKTKAADLLFNGKEFTLFERVKVRKEVHGTGCFLSSSLLCHLALGHPLKKACSMAIMLTHEAIKAARTTGRGQKLISFPQA